MSGSYYMMESRVAPGQVGTRIEEWPSVPGVRSWKTGARLAMPIAEPLRFVLDSEYGSELPPLINSTFLLMHRRLIEALCAAGVDNLDTYEAVVLDPRDARKHTSHLAVNIVGSIAAANLGQSGVDLSQSNRLIAVDFEGVALDVEKTRGALLFRLAECVSAIVVHAKVKRRLEATPFPGLEFIEPAQWMG